MNILFLLLMMKTTKLGFDIEHSTFILADNLYTNEYNEETNTNTIKFGTNEYVIPGI